MSVTTELAAFIAKLQYTDLPHAVTRRTHLLLLDLVGNIVRARHDADSTPALLEAAHALGLSGGDCHVFADASGYTPAGAALVNGTLAHSLDFDDTHAAAVLHPGAPVIAAAFAAAEMTGAAGSEILAAVVAGYETGCRIALALPAGAHYDRGFHPSATCGAFGAAAAAARVFGLDAEGVASALGIALSQSAGSLQFLANGAWTKRFQVGWAGLAGVTAATLARAGFKGAADALDGRHGFLRAYAPTPQPDRVVQQLGEAWELMQTGVKPYPSCRWAHAGIDAALALRAGHGLRGEEVESVVLGVSRAAMLLVGEPAAKKADPHNVVDAQFSGPFVIAAALNDGAVGWDSYARLHDTAIRALLPKIICENDPEIEAEFPANMSGKLTVRARGETFICKVVVPRGEPTNFLTEAELRAKFNGLAVPLLGAAPAEALGDAVLRLEHLPGVGALFAFGAATA
jgi:2-methylcitrate dehydratase PrpD